MHGQVVNTILISPYFRAEAMSESISVMRLVLVGIISHKIGKIIENIFKDAVRYRSIIRIGSARNKPSSIHT